MGLLKKSRHYRTGLIKTKKGYLFWAIFAFLLAPFGFGGILVAKGGRTDPIYAGISCIVMGCILLYFYFTAE